MRIERNELFRELTPPEGGAARMRARLAAEPGNVPQAGASHAAQPLPGNEVPRRSSDATRPRVHIMPLSRAFPQALRDFATFGVAAVLLLAVLAAIGLVTAPPLDRGSIDGDRIAGDEALQRSELYASADLDRLLGRPSMPFELTVSLGDERLEVTEIPTRDPRVRIVRVEESLAN